MTVKAQILAHLLDIEDLLLEAECDGEQLAALDCYSDVEAAVSTLTQAIDYYVD